MKYLNVKPTAQSEVSRKEKNKYHMLTYIYIYMGSRKMVLMNLCAGQQWRHRHRGQTYGHSVGERVGHTTNGGSGVETYSFHM